MLAASSGFSDPSDNPHILKFNGFAKPPRAASEPTLSQVYSNRFRPTLELRAGKTREAYDDAIRHWKRYTGDPPVREITPTMLREFQAKLAKRQRGRKTVSPQTVDKTFRHLRPVINVCMPRDRLNPEGLGLIDYLTFPKPVAKGTSKPNRFNLDELERLYAACETADWPKRQPVPAPLQWRAAIVCLYNLGPRVYDLLLREWADVSWRWEDGLHPFGGLEFRASKTSKLQRVPFNAVVQAHLREMKVGQRRQVFAGNWQPSNRKTINAQWARIVATANIEPHKPLVAFRSTCNTALNRIRPGVGEWVLGHSPRGVNARNYTDPTDEVFETILAMPQPELFYRGLACDIADKSPRLARPA